MLLIPKLRVGYQNVPKVATTSMFDWLYQAHGVVPKVFPDHPNSKRNFFMSRYKSESIEEIQQTEGTYLRFALTRDPVQRFLSMYGNRVIAKRKLDIDADDGRLLLDAGLSPNPQLNALIDSLRDYLSASRHIFHHARSQLDFLGHDFSVYDHLLDISNSDHLIDLIRQHWRKQGMDQAILNADQRLPRLQRSGPKISLDGISRRSFEKLLEYYQEDYKAIPTLDQESIKAQFIQENGGTNLFSFDFLKAHKPEVEVRGVRFTVEHNKRKEVQEQRIRLGEDPTGGIVLFGAVVLSSSASACKLSLTIEGAPQSIEWGLRSKYWEEKFPRHPNSSHARFQASGLSFLPDHVAELNLVYTNGVSKRLGRVTRLCD